MDKTIISACLGILEKLRKFKKLTKLVLNLQSLSDLVSFLEKHTLWTNTNKLCRAYISIVCQYITNSCHVKDVLLNNM